MNNNRYINWGIKAVGWFLIINSIINFLYLSTLIFYSKEAIDQLYDAGELPSYMVPMVSVAMFYMGRGILKKQQLARFAFIILTIIGICVGLPIKILEYSIRLEDIISLTLSAVGAVFLLFPSVGNNFVYNTDWVNSKSFPLRKLRGRKITNIENKT
jgi:hypothetical protein